MMQDLEASQPRLLAEIADTGGWEPRSTKCAGRLPPFSGVGIQLRPLCSGTDRGRVYHAKPGLTYLGTYLFVS